MSKKMKVIELFAGVGGFRIGLEGYPKKKNTPYEVVWANQWEPSKKKQVAADVYRNRWPKKSEKHLVNEDINKIKTDEIPNHNILTAGFPCQDYSVANTLKLSGGLIGKKGVLWWNIEKNT